MRRRNDRSTSGDEYATAFPMVVIGSASILIAAYLAVGSAILSLPETKGRVYISISDVPEGRIARTAR